MLLHRLHLDPRSREARRDLADPYQMHSTLCRAFAGPDVRVEAGAFLWRAEPEQRERAPQLLVQSRGPADWHRINVPGWASRIDDPVDLEARLRPLIAIGRRFRFRLRANPSVSRDGKRVGLMDLSAQLGWILRKGAMHGFALDLRNTHSPDPRPDVLVSEEGMVRARQHDGNGIRVFAVRYDGELTVEDTERFASALQSGIGHGKAVGLGLLSVAPV